MDTKKQLKKIILALIIIVLVPALLFIAKEISTLTDSEKLINKIYGEQLETILFSVNQYCLDVSNSWASQVNSSQYIISPADRRKSLESLITRNQAIQAVFFADSMMNDVQMFSKPNDSLSSNGIANLISHTSTSRQSISNKLLKYRKAGYRKIQPVALSNIGGAEQKSMALLFSTEISSNRRFQLAGILISPQIFIRTVLFPKLREVAGERFVIVVRHGEEEFSYAPTTGADLANVSEQKEIWLLPNYFLAIRPQGQTFEELARDRFYQNLFLIALLALVLIGAVWFIYRNIRREMELAQLKSDFVSNISHELRTPLSMIRMFAETLEMGRVSSEQRKQEYYQIIGQESERLTHLINNILNFSRIDADKKAYHFQPLDLNAVVKKVIEKYQFHLKNAGFSLETALHSGLPVIQADLDAVTEALLNLIDNGIKYSKDNKWIRIHTGQENGAVFVEIQDRGIGISLAEQEKIFEKFHRVSSALVHNTKGSGLGLTLVKHIADAHGGSVTVHSHPDKGSRFRITFPTNHVSKK